MSQAPGLYNEGGQSCCLKDLGTKDPSAIHLEIFTETLLYLTVSW